MGLCESEKYLGVEQQIEIMWRQLHETFRLLLMSWLKFFQTLHNCSLFLLQVAWMHFEQSAILTVHNHVITRNPRISVTHDKHDKHRTWFLHINNVQEEDKGRYMCQINTVTAKTQFGYLHVVGKSFPTHTLLQFIRKVN